MSSFCEKCERTMDDSNFYTHKDGTKPKLCKKCMTMHIDNFKEDTYLWLLEEMDVPYIPGIWNGIRNKAIDSGKALNGMSVFGKYLSQTKLKQWKDYG